MADILLNFGVDGGGSTATGSGKVMYDQVRAIVQSIERNLTRKLSVKFSQESLNALNQQVSKALTIQQVSIATDAATNLRNQIQTILNQGKFTINVEGAVNGLKAGNTLSANSGTSTGTTSRSVTPSSTNTSDTSLGSVVKYGWTQNDQGQLVRDIRSQTDAFRELNGVVTNITTTYDKEGHAVTTVSNSTRELAAQVDGLSRKYTNLRDKIDVTRNAAESNLGVSRVGQLASEVESTTRRIENLRTALNSSLSGNTNAYKSKKVGIEDFSSDQEAIRKLEQYIEQATQQYARLRLEIQNASAETERLSQMTKQIALVDTKLRSLNKADYSKDQLNDVRNQVNNLHLLSNAIKEYESLSSSGKNKFKWEDRGFTNIKNYEEALRTLESSILKANNALTTLQTSSSAVSYDRVISQARTLAEAYSRFTAAPGAQSNSSLYNSSEIQGYISSLARYNQLVSEGKENDAEALQIKQKLQAAYPAITKRIKELNLASTQLENTHRRETNITTQMNKIYQEADSYYKKYQAGIQRNIKLNQQWNQLREKLRTDGFVGDTGTARAELASLMSATKEANAEVTGLWGSIKKLFKDHFGSVSATMAIGMFRNLLRTSYQYVLDIDKAMTELRKVTELTEAQYEAFGNTAARIAREVGGSIADTVSATADFARLGFDFEGSQSLAKAALIYKNVGDGIEDISEASESIISTIKAFKDIDPNDAMSIIDKFNRIGNEFAISSKGVGEALRRSAAALAAGGNDLNHSIGLVVAGNTVIQDPDVVGTTLKTVSMYLRAAKTSAEEAGIETDGMAKSVSKLREDILKLADVDIMFDDENFKGTYEILDEIAKKWDEISDIDRSNLLNLMGGKRNANVLASIIENFDEARAAVEAAEDSAGSATKENEKWLESIQGHLNQLKVTFEEFSQRIMESDFIKGAIDFLTGIVKALDKITEAFGGMTPIVLGFLGNSFFNHNKWGFSTALVDGHRQLTLFGRTMGEISTTFSTFQKNTNAATGTAKHFFTSIGNGFRTLGSTFVGRLSDRFGFVTKAEMNSNIQMIKDYQAELENIDKLQSKRGIKRDINTTYKNWLNGAGKDASKEVRNMAHELDRLYVKGENATRAINQFAESQRAVQKGSSLLRSVLGGLGSTLMSFGTTMLFNLAFQGITSAIQKSKEAMEQAKKAAESFQETYGKTDQSIQKIIQLRTELDDNNTSELRAKAIKLELIDIQNQLAETYGTEAKNVNLATADLDAYIKKLREVNQEKYKDIDYYKQSGGINAINSQFNNAGLQLDMRAFRRAGLDYYESNGAGLDNVMKTLDSLWESLGFIRTYTNDHSKTLNGYKFDGDIFTADEKLLEAQKKIEEYINDDTLTESVRDHYQKAFNYIAEVRSEFVDKVLEGQASFEAWIVNSSEYSDKYDELIRAQANYQYKISKAKNEAEARQIRQEYQDALDKAFAGIDEEKDPAVLQWFKSEFEIPESEISTTKEKIKSKYALLYEELQSSLDELKSLYEGAFSGRSTIQSAYDKIISGTALTSDEVLKLVDTCKEAFPEISTVFEKTANGYTANASDLIRANEAIQKSAEKALRETMQKYQSIVEAYESRATTIPVNDWTKGGTPGIEVSRTDIGIDEEAYKDAKNKIEEYRLILQMLGVSLDDTSKKGTELGNVLKTLSSEISIGAKAEKEMTENGTLAAATIESITSLGEEYWKCLTVQNGQIKLNVDAYKELTKAKLADEIATLRLAKAEVERLFPSEYSAYHHLTDETQALYDDIKNKLAIAEGSYDSFDTEWKSALESGSSQKDDAESERNKLYEKRYKELERVNNGTLAAEKQFVNDWIALNEEIYKSTDPDKYKENLEKIVDYITSADSKVKSHMEEWSRDNGYDENDPASRYEYLREWETSSSVLDNELTQVITDLAEIEGKANSATKELKEFNKSFQKTYQLGNVDLTKRPKVSAEDGSTMTVYSGGEYVWQGDEKNGKYVYVYYTPILDDGSMLSDEEVNAYIRDSLTGSDSILEADANGKRIVLKVDTDLNLSEEDIRALDNGGWTDSLENTTRKLDEWAIGLHDASAEWLELTDRVKEANTELAVARKQADAYNARRLDVAEYEAETMKLEYENGDYESYADYSSDILSLGDRYRAADGGKLLDGTFFSKYIKANDQFDAWLEDENKKFSDTIEDRTSLLTNEREELMKHKEGLDGRTQFTTKEFEDNYSKYADEYVNLIKQKVEKGILTNKEAQQELQTFFRQAATDGADLGTSWLNNNVLNFDSYEEELEKLQRINDGAIESEKEFIQSWKDLNRSTYGDESSLFYDPAKYKANIKTITDYELEELKKAFEKGEISAKEYAESVTKALKDADILGNEYVSEALKDADKAQAEQEKSYWEDQKQRVSDYYDMELQKLQDIKDEKEQIAKAEELQLNLIKARVELEKAKSQRNQLIFQNGSFFYDVDQEAVMDKANAVAEAEDAIVAQKLDDEIQLLTEQKDAALEYYSDIIEMIEAYIGETKSITESNPEIFNKIVNSEYSQEIKKRQKGELKPNELTDEQLNATGTGDKTKANADAAVTKAATEEHKSDEERKKEWKEYITQPITNLFSEVINLVKLSGVSLTSSLLFGSNSPAQDQTAAGLGNIQSAASINNDNSVNVGDITMHIQGGTSEEMLKQFASKLSAAISAALPRATVKQ